jgi:hypothetical protein
MLSASYSIIDIKAELRKDYTFFGYDDDACFRSDLTRVIDDVTRRYYIPRIGQTEYDRIAAKNKVSLTVYETDLYWAEVFTVCYEFIHRRSSEQGMLQNSSDETLTVEGYTHRLGGGGGSGISQGDNVLRDYWSIAFEYWKLAGYNLSALERTCTIFGDSILDEETINIIE